MKMLLKKLLCVALSLALLCSLGGAALAQESGDLPEPGDSALWEDPFAEDGEGYIAVPRVQWNGEYIDFADALPELVDGRVMVPFRAIAEAMGFTVGYADGSVTAAADGRTLAFTVGEFEYTVTDGTGVAQGVSDVAPYIRDGRTYVPARFFAEALGYTALWDEWSETTVIYDRAALAEDIDSRFTVLGAWLEANAARAEAMEPMHTSLGFGVDYTLFDSIDGDEAASISGSGEGDIGPSSARVSVTFEDAAVLIELLDAPELSEALGGLDTLSIDYILDKENGLTYVYCPELTSIILDYRFLFEALGYELPDDIDNAENVWLSMSAEDSYYETAGMELASIGEFIVTQAENESWDYTLVYYDILWLVDQLELFLGDAVFTREGSVCTAEYDCEADDGSLMGDALLINDIEYLRGFISLDTETGDMSADIDMRAYDYSTGLFGSDVLVELEMDMSSEGENMRLLLHHQNNLLLEMEINSAYTPADEAPPSAPPEDAVIIDLDVLSFIF